MLSGHHLNELEEDCELLEVYLLLILLRLEGIALDHGVLEQTEVAERVKVKLWVLELLKSESVAAIGALINNLVEQVPLVDNVLGLSDDFIAPVVIVVVAEAWILIQ